MQLSRFLRAVLRLDSASCLLMAAALAPASGLLAPVLGIPASMLTGAGISLVPVGLFILWLSSQERAAPALVYLVVFGNLGWTAASLASLTVLPAITGVGLALLVGQAAAVALFAMLEFRGIRESVWISAA